MRSTLNSLGRDDRARRAGPGLALALLLAASVLAVTAARPGSAAPPAPASPCAGPAKLADDFALAGPRTVAVRSASCETGAAVVAAFARSCFEAYAGQDGCRLDAGLPPRWTCASGIVGSLAAGVPSRVSCRRGGGTVTFVVARFPPGTVAPDGADAVSRRAGIYDEAGLCVRTGTPSRSYPPPANGVFQLEMLGTRDQVPRSYAEKIQNSLIAKGVQRKLFDGLGERPNGYPPRPIPVYLAPREFNAERDRGIAASTCPNRALEALIVRVNIPSGRAAVTAHELFHAHAFWVLGRGAPTVPWWEEASATWFEGRTGFREEDGFDPALQFPQEPLDSTNSQHAYAMSRFVQFLDDRGLVGNATWPLQRQVIPRYPGGKDAVNEALASALAARGTSLTNELAAFWGDRIREKPSHGLGLVATPARTVTVQPGTLTVMPAAKPLTTWFTNYKVSNDVERVEFEFEPNTPTPGRYWGGVTANRSEEFRSGDTISFCTSGPDGDDYEWPQRGFPVVYTNGRLTGGEITSELQIFAQASASQCTAPTGNLACQILQRINIGGLLGAGFFPFHSRGDDTWRCVFVDREEEQEADLIVLFIPRDVPLRRARRQVRRALEKGGFRIHRDLGDIGGIMSQQVEGTVVHSVLMLVGREEIFFNLYNSTREDALTLGKRIVRERG